MRSSSSRATRISLRSTQSVLGQRPWHDLAATARSVSRRPDDRRACQNGPSAGQLNAWPRTSSWARPARRATKPARRPVRRAPIAGPVFTTSGCTGWAVSTCEAADASAKRKSSARGRPHRDGEAHQSQRRLLRARCSRSEPVEGEARTRHLGAVAGRVTADDLRAGAARIRTRLAALWPATSPVTKSKRLRFACASQISTRRT